VVSAQGFCDSYTNFNGRVDTSEKTVTWAGCNGNNCNNVLICYTGFYYQNQKDDSVTTFKPSLCNYDENQVCQTQVTWNEVNGYVFTGACKAQDGCTSVEPQLTGDTATTGTYCCTSQYCNSVSGAFQYDATTSNSNQLAFNLKFHSNSNSNQLKSSVLSLFIALLAFKSF